MSSDDPTFCETAQLIRVAFERTEAPLGAIHSQGLGAAEAYQRALMNLFAVTTRHKQEWSKSDIARLVYLIGSPWPQLSRNAATVFLSLMYLCHDQLCAYVDGCLQKTVSVDHQSQLVADCREALLNAVERGNVNPVRAFRNRRSRPPSPGDILAWLEHEQVQFCPVVNTPSLQIHVAKLVSKARKFNGAWMELSPNKHVLLVGTRLEDRVHAVYHELEHVFHWRRRSVLE